MKIIKNEEYYDILESSTHYLETVDTFISAEKMKGELSVRDYQHYVESCDRDRHYAHEALMISYRVYYRTTGQLIEHVDPYDRYAIANLAMYLIKKEL